MAIDNFRGTQIGYNPTVKQRIEELARSNEGKFSFNWVGTHWIMLEVH